MFVKFSNTTKMDLEEVKKSQEFLSLKFDGLINSMGVLQAENTELRSENVELKSRIEKLEDQAKSNSNDLEFLKQYSCRDLLEISMLYYSLVYPYIQYCVAVWGSTYPTTTVVFWEYIYLLNFMGKFMYLYHNKLLPRSFDNFFLLTNQVHNYNTRNSKLYYPPFCRTKITHFPLTTRV